MSTQALQRKNSKIMRKAIQVKRTPILQTKSVVPAVRRNEQPQPTVQLLFSEPAIKDVPPKTEISTVEQVVEGPQDVTPPMPEEIDC